MAASAAADLFKNAVTVKGLQVVTGMPGEMKPDALRLMIDEARGNHPDAVIALGSVFGGKGTIAVACGTEAVKAGVNAGKARPRSLPGSPAAMAAAAPIAPWAVPAIPKRSPKPSPACPN